MSERRPSPEVRPTKPEQVNKLETRERKDQVTQEVARATLLWTEVLARDSKLNELNLSRERRLGAAFVPALLFTAAMGCSQFNKIECGEDDDAFVAASIDWITVHPEEIQIEMDKRWPHQKIQAEDLINVLQNVEIYCAEPRNPITIDASAQANLVTRHITIDVKNDLYEISLSDFKKSQWVSDLYTLDELIELSYVSNKADQAIQGAYADYLEGVKYTVDQLAHEAAHLAAHVGHSQETRKFLDAHGAARDADYDEVYAWGHAANRAVEIESFNAYWHSLE